MYELLKSQKNEVFKIIKGQGLEPADFSWDIGEFTTPSKSKDLLAVGKTVDVHKVPKLIYKNSQFYFQFGLLKGQHHCTFSPGREKPLESQFPGAWVHLSNYIKEWLHNLKKEIEAPDLWQEMEKYKTAVSLAVPEQLTNEPIPAAEAEEIASKLSLLADKIEEQFELTEQQNQFVRSKLNYLEGAAKRQRSSDWVHTSIGVFITIAMGLALAPERAKELWQLIENLIGGFIRLIGS